MKRICENKTSYIVLIDLDGTLIDSKVNNTYHFILCYYTKLLRLENLGRLIYRILNKSIDFLTRLLGMFGFHIDIDTLLISVLFLGRRVKLLKILSIYWTKAIFRKEFFKKM